MKSNMINEHDITKNMINKIRLIREDVSAQLNPEQSAPEEAKPEKEVELLDDNGNVNPDIPETMKTYVKGSDSEQQKFINTVTPFVKFTKFSIIPKDNITLSGIINKYNINFMMDMKSGLTISTQPSNTSQPPTDIKLDDEVMEILKKLRAHYGNWSKDWAEKINTEF